MYAVYQIVAPFDKVSDKDVRKYVTCILKDGEIQEKRQLLASLESTLTLANKVLAVK